MNTKLMFASSGCPLCSHAIVEYRKVSNIRFCDPAGESMFCETPESPHYTVEFRCTGPVRHQFIYLGPVSEDLKSKDISEYLHEVRIKTLKEVLDVYDGSSRRAPQIQKWRDEVDATDREKKHD